MSAGGLFIVVGEGRQNGAEVRGRGYMELFCGSFALRGSERAVEGDQRGKENGCESAERIGRVCRFTVT